MKLRKGTPETKEFYDRIGWQPQEDGTLGDWVRFAWGEGSIQKGLDLQRKSRIRRMVDGPGLNIIELACGANPAVFLAEGCKSYTAVDFSLEGLTKAGDALRLANVPSTTL